MRYFIFILFYFYFVNVYSQISAGQDRFVCPKSTIILEGKNVYNLPSYWLQISGDKLVNDVDTSYKYTSKISGFKTDSEYSFIFTDSIHTDTVNIFTIGIPYAGNDSLYYNTREFTLNGNNLKYGMLLWRGDNCNCTIYKQNESKTLVKVNSVGVYEFRYVFIGDDCESEDIIKINIKDTSISNDTISYDSLPCLFIPNSFTPNDDNLNDFFLPITSNIISYKLIIYNRWGTEIYEGDKWDGKYIKEPCFDGVYLYMLTYKYYIKNSLIENNITGRVFLFR